MKTLKSWLILVAVLAQYGCPSESEVDTGKAEPTKPATSAPAPSKEKLFAKAIANVPGRSADAAARDAGRKPAEILAFLGLAPGMTVLDVFAAGGWYSEVLSAAVGPGGRVIAQNPPRLLELRDGMYEKELTARLGSGRLANVQRVDKSLAESGIEAGSVDLALTALNFHDMYYLISPEAAAATLTTIYGMLKPGGVLGIVDHYGAAGADNASLHRIEPKIAKELAVGAGFVVEDESAVLHNHNDDRTLIVFDPSVMGNTHRFVLRLRKP